MRRSGSRLRINAQLVDTSTDFPLWSDRYDREMKDIFEVQDEIARKIAEALRITLSPQEQEAIAAKPTENLQAAEAALEASGTDYNVYVPIQNALGALGKDEALRNFRHREILALENHLRQVPGDARARILLAVDYAAEDRVEDAVRETNLAVALRPNEATVLYNAACNYCLLKRKLEAIEALRKAWDAGFRDADWARRDPDLALLHGDPDFEGLYPERTAATDGRKVS